MKTEDSEQVTAAVRRANMHVQRRSLSGTDLLCRSHPVTRAADSCVIFALNYPLSPSSPQLADFS